MHKVFKAEGNTISSITENEKPVVIVTADRQEYNKTTNVMKAFGNVNILYKNIDTLSNQAIVDLTKEGMDKYVGSDVALAKKIADELGLELVLKPMAFVHLRPSNP